MMLELEVADRTTLAPRTRPPLELYYAPTLEVSLVVPTCRRDALLTRCLHALVEQDFDARAYEIIVVDDAACETTRALVAEFASRYRAPRLTYLAMPEHRGPAAARNRGWQHARAKIIAFTDDDTVPQPDWLRHGAQAFADNNLLAEPIHAVAGQVVVPIAEPPTDYERNVAGLERAEFLTANC